MQKRPLIILGILFFAFIASTLVWGARHHHETCALCFMRPFSMDIVRHYVESFGALAIIVYVVLYTINTLILIPPIALMSFSAGALFGPFKGTLALGLGVFCGTTATFVISRLIGNDFINHFFEEKTDAWHRQLNRIGFRNLLPIRFTGLPPYEFVNYASHRSQIPYTDYIAASMLGMAPAVIIQVLLSDRLANFNGKDPVLYLAIFLFLAMFVITHGMRQKHKQEQTFEGTINPTQF